MPRWHSTCLILVLRRKSQISVSSKFEASVWSIVNSRSVTATVYNTLVSKKQNKANIFSLKWHLSLLKNNKFFSMQINSNHQLYFNLADFRLYAMSTANSLKDLLLLLRISTIQHTNVKWVERSRLKEVDTERGHK